MWPVATETRTGQPSISYSITVRLELPAGGSAISRLTTCVEEAGGIVTALDVTASGHDKLRIDVTCAASDTAHADRIVEALRGIEGVDGAQGLRPDVPDAPRRHDRDGLQAPDPQPRRPLDGLHARASPGSARRSPRTPRTPAG